MHRTASSLPQHHCLCPDDSDSTRDPTAGAVVATVKSTQTWGHHHWEPASQSAKWWIERNYLTHIPQLQPGKQQPSFTASQGRGANQVTKTQEYTNLQDENSRALWRGSGLTKLWQPHSHSLVSTRSTMQMAQLHCFTTNLCRDIHPTKFPGSWISQMKILKSSQSGGWQSLPQTSEAPQSHPYPTLASL